MSPQHMAVCGREVTEDSLFDGALKCLQYTDGYRFSIDAVLAAHFCKPGKDARVLDVGTGCGIISLVMMYRWPDRITSICCLELQHELGELAERNFALNGFSKSCEVVKGSIKNGLELFEPESFSHVVCNPPFYPVASGRQSGDEQSRVARHQVSATIEDFARGSATLLKNGGNATFIYPADQAIFLFQALMANRLVVKRVQFIYSYPEKGQEARLVLAECRKNGGPGTRILEPFYIYKEKNGEYTEDMQALYAGNNQAA